MPNKYKLRTALVTALQISPDTMEEIIEITHHTTVVNVITGQSTGYLVTLTTPGGASINGRQGDYLFQDAQGLYHLYPRSTFERSYEPVNPTPPREPANVHNITFPQKGAFLQHQPPARPPAERPLDAVAVPL